MRMPMMAMRATQCTAMEKTRMQGERSVNSPAYTDSHYTPEWVYSPLGPFDLDPCAGPNTIAAANYDYARGHDGMALPWFGLVWCNPPYSLKSGFISRLSAHGSGFALLPSSSDAKWWHEAAGSCSAFLLMKGRVQFLDANHKPQKGNTKGSTIFAYGDIARDRLQKAVESGKLKGFLVVKG